MNAITYECNAVGFNNGHHYNARYYTSIKDVILEIKDNRRLNRITQVTLMKNFCYRNVKVLLVKQIAP